ncbi:MAG: hypothetical protein EA427_12340 [Spirochaetaceae bacterium]|nr:MAG: hypothetical protein EA427_12340 [Spirochaetaceae bacterium]
MGMNEKTRLTVNRVAAMLAGGLLVFAVMSFTVVSNANNRIDELSRSLDTSRYEAGRLLADAEEQLAAGNYVQATASLETLFEHQPGSAEATEGRALLTTVRNAENAENARWDAAMPEIRAQWTADFAANLRAESTAARAELEENMDTMVGEEWTKVMNDIREEWELERES